MRPKQHCVELTDEERTRLLLLIRQGRAAARSLVRAHILLNASEGAFDHETARALHVDQRTVERVRRRFATAPPESRLERTLRDRPRPGAAPRLDGKQEAFLVALACSKAPEGREHWTMQLLADRLVELGVVESISDETVRRTLTRPPEAVPEDRVLHSGGRCGVCGGHGGCPGCLRGAARPRSPARQPGRDVVPAACRRHAVGAAAGFAGIAAGGIGSVLAGAWADRLGRENIAAWAMVVSGACALSIGWLVGAPVWVVVCLSVVWGFAVVADSAQFSALVTEVAPAHAVGTALTLQTSLGFLLTAFSIWLTFAVRARWGWGAAFAMLAVGPAVGIWQILKLKRVRTV